jgi:glycosyltransferase involved in cell wall biosynthesis
MSKFSIVIPTLNEEKFLPNLLSALTQQTKKDFEVVVVDGSSSDNTVAVAHSFNAKLPKLQVCLSEKANLPLQRNIGARAAAGEWLVFVDADSTPLPYFIERLERFIEERNPKILTTWFRPDSEASGDALFTLFSNLWVESALAVHRPVALGPLTAVKREVFDLVNGYNETLAFGEDYDLTRRVVAQGIALQILRETLYIISLRRMRREGKPRYIWLMMKASLLVLFTKRNLHRVPSYIMGGHLYETDKKI